MGRIHELCEEGDLDAVKEAVALDIDDLNNCNHEVEIIRKADKTGEEWKDLFSGCRPIHCAAVRGHKSIVEFIVRKSKAQLHAKTEGLSMYKSEWNNLGCFPLHFAAMCGHIEIVSYLVEKGADIEAQNDVCKLCDFDLNACYIAIVCVHVLFFFCAQSKLDN
jgi:ankyrin repeat protein